MFIWWCEDRASLLERVYKVEQLRALALMFLSLRAQAANSYMVFFGCYNLLLGYLISRSIFLPQIVGVFRVAD
jgi:hypothetical protein